MKKITSSCNLNKMKTAIEKQTYYIKKDITISTNSLIDAMKHSTLNFYYTIILFYYTAKQLCRKKNNTELHDILLD